MKVSFPYLEGLEKPGGSEKAWAINIAKLFSQLGHEVYLGNGFLEQGLIADIMCLPERIDLRDDQTDWNFYKDRARKFLFGVFNPNGSPYLDNVLSNSHLITPYRSCGTKCYVLPYAYYTNKPEPGYARKTIGWTVRNPFDYAGRIENTHHIHLHHLKACMQLVKEGGCKFILFSNHTYPSDRSGLPNLISEAHEILDELRSHPATTVVDNLLYSEYIKLLGQTSIVVPLDGLGSITEALKLGSVPLSWNSPVNIYENFPNKEYRVVTFENIKSKLSRLLTDEEYYNTEYNTLLDKAAVYDLDSALQMVKVVIAA